MPGLTHSLICPPELTLGPPLSSPCAPVQLGLLNVADYNFVQRAVEAVHAALQAALTSGDCLNIRLGLRILATLVRPPPPNLLPPLLC
jgi:hypothetical protein